jgi:hypothetical protein
VRRRSRRPPRTVCRECGTTVYSYRSGPLCPACAKTQAELLEAGWVRRAQIAAGNRRPNVDELGPGAELEQLSLDDPPAAA